MGKIVEKKKKKKGRPSLLDLQKRSLKQQQEQLLKQKKKQQHQLRNKTHHFVPNPNPNSRVRRSTRRNPNPNSDLGSDDDDDEEEGSTSKRREKRLNLFLKKELEPKPEPKDEGNSGSDSNPDEVGSSGSNLRKRKIDSIVPGSGLDNADKDEKPGTLAKRTSTQQGSKLEDGPSTPLPDKKLLLFILERLQKKDTYGVFAEPVDPEELPDYHEVIRHPMDFSTVRKKLLDSAYANLEQFEKDIFLICSNAMQYNAPDTIYFRQARAIQEMAKKDFENLRQDSDDNEPESAPKVVRRGRPPTKNFLKRPPGRPPLERPNSNFSEATPSTTGGTTNRSNNDVRKGPPVSEKQSPADLFAQSLYGARYGEALNGWSAERYERSEDLTGSASKGTSGKNWKKNNVVLDENRRNTYMQTSASACRQEVSVLTTFDGERKLLIPVGLHTEYGYARSLSRFAAKLGPIAWKVASRKIERCLPDGVKFGRGWVAENEAPAEVPTRQQLPSVASQQAAPASLSISRDKSSAPTQGIIESCGDKLVPTPHDGSLPEVSRSSSQSKFDDGSTKISTPSTVLSNGVGSKLNEPEASASFHPSNTASNLLNSNTVASAARAAFAYQTHQSSQNQSRINGLNGSYGLNFVTQMGKMIGAARPSVSNLQSNQSARLSRTETQNPDPPTGDSNDCGEAKLSEKSNAIKSTDYLPNAGQHQRVDSGPPDLNVGFQSPGSPGSGRADSLHPDLALQL